MNSTTTPTVQTYENEYINISFYGDEVECKALAIYRFMGNDYLLYGFENGEKLNVYAGIVKSTNDITYLEELKTETELEIAKTVIDKYYNEYFKEEN